MKIRIFSFLTFVLLFLCLFDPQNKLFGIKDIIFIVLIFLFIILSKNKKYYFPLDITKYILLFISIPIISILFFLLRNQIKIPIDYQGFIYFKCYLFLFIIFIFINYKVDVLKIVLFWLSIMAILTILFNIIALPGSELHLFGDKYGIFAMDYRQYGALKYSYTYFHTSPLFVISLSYYLSYYLEKREVKYLALSVLSFTAILASGTRNNILAGCIILVTMFFYRLSSLKKLLFIMTIGIWIVFFVLSSETISAMFSSSNMSNFSKISFISDYKREILKIPDFFIGKGLGSTFYVTINNSYQSVTELTYLETIRRYGIVLGVITFLCMFYPLIILWKNRQYRWLALAYLLYLIMSAFNPFYFSSNGMIILSIVLYLIYINRNNNEEKFSEYCSS